MAFLMAQSGSVMNRIVNVGAHERVCNRRQPLPPPRARATPYATMRPSGDRDVRNPGEAREGIVSERPSEGAVEFVDYDDGVVDIMGGDYDLVEEKTKKVRLRTSQLLNAINKEKESNLSSDADSLPPIAEDETMAWVRTVVRAGDTRKAANPVAIRVMRVTYITSFIVALTGNSGPQLRAIANLVEENMFKEHGMNPKRTSGVPQSGWILLDYGDMIVNIFSPEQRANYNLEGHWKEGEIADVSDCIAQGHVEDEKKAGSEEESLDDWV